jgi:hypothetical protein
MKNCFGRKINVQKYFVKEKLMIDVRVYFCKERKSASILFSKIKLFSIVFFFCRVD